MNRKSRKSRGFEANNRADPVRFVAALIVLLIGLLGLVVIGYALAGSMAVNKLLIALGALWLAAVAVLNSAARQRVNGVEPQAALITLGLALPLSADPLSLTFVFICLACLVFWGRRGFRF